MDIKEINEYYQNLNIKPYWNLDSLTIDEINTIVKIFDELHRKYPEVVIEEIGDYYSFDKISRDELLIVAKENLETNAFAKHEFYIKNPELIEKAEENMRMIIVKYEHEEVNVDDVKYDNMDSAALYFSHDRRIKFNHKSSNSVKELTYHEFGHAIAYQYDLNDDVNINSLFNSSNKDTIESLVTEYGTTNVKEFIAEIFMLYCLDISNELINSIMEIINEKVINGNAMSELQKFKKKIFTF